MLPGVANAERQKYPQTESVKKLPHSNRQYVERERNKRDDRYRAEKRTRLEHKQKNIKQRRDSSHQKVEKKRNSRSDLYRHDRRSQPEYRSRRQHYPDYQHRPRVDDRGRVSRHRHKVIINHPRHYYRGTVFLKPHRHYYPHRYRPLYLKENNIWAWIAFTAITLRILDNLNDQQQREHERAIYGSISIPIGDTMTWSRGSAAGTVTPIWEGRSNTGLYCREFRQEITISERTEVAHGTACQRSDGSWEIVD